MASTIYIVHRVVEPRYLSETQCLGDSHPSPLEIEGLFAQGWQPSRTIGKSVGGIFEMDSSDLSNEIRYHTLSTRPDTELNDIL